jgi:hypothetical protein
VTPTWRRYQEVQVFDFPARKTVDWDAVISKISDGLVPAEWIGMEKMPETPSEIERKAASDPAFAARLKEARQLGAVSLLAECKKIADDPALRADQKRIRIDIRLKLAAIWNPADCREVAKTEQVVTVRDVSPREQYIADCESFLGMSREQAAARYALETGQTLQ